MERPILFSVPMVRAILDGRKTQTRRVIPDRAMLKLGPNDYHIRIDGVTACPYGMVGDSLYVREAWARVWYNAEGGWELRYRASYGEPASFPWKPSIHMPREASRITLEITGVRVERLRDISEDDAIAEGVDAISVAAVPRQSTLTRRADFKQLWDGFNAKRGYSWESNPWVWALTFKRVVSPSLPAEQPE